MNVQINHCNNLLILDVKQLYKIMKLYYFFTLKALWDDQGKIKMYYGTSKVKKQILGKRSIMIDWNLLGFTIASYQAKPVYGIFRFFLEISN